MAHKEDSLSKLAIPGRLCLFRPSIITCIRWAAWSGTVSGSGPEIDRHHAPWIRLHPAVAGLKQGCPAVWWPDGSDGGLTLSRSWIGRRGDAPAHRRRVSCSENRLQAGGRTAAGQERLRSTVEMRTTSTAWLPLPASLSNAKRGLLRQRALFADEFGAKFFL